MDSIFTVLVVKVARNPFSPFSTRLHCTSLIDLDCDNNPGGGGTSLNKPYRFVPHQKVCFLCRYSLKTGKDFTHFGLESGMALEGTTGVYERIFCFKPKWKRNREKYANSKWILKIFWLTFWSKYEWWHNFCLGRSEKGCGNDIFMVWNRVRIWGIRWYSSTKNS